MPCGVPTSISDDSYNCYTRNVIALPGPILPRLQLLQFVRLRSLGFVFVAGIFVMQCPVYSVFLARLDVDERNAIRILSEEILQVFQVLDVVVSIDPSHMSDHPILIILDWPLISFWVLRSTPVNFHLR